MISEYLIPIANHLWQTTLFVSLVLVLALSLRKNSASIRYRLWMAASIKFLIPFSVLVATGSNFQSRTTALAERPQIATVVENIIEPFFVPDSVPTSSVSSQPAQRSLAIPLVIIWLCGFFGTLFFWARWWLSMRRTVRSAAAVTMPGVLIPVFCCQHRIEPGVFGILRPALLIPEGMLERLTVEQLHTIVAHELAHVQRRDNLSMTIHMLVEAVFWFHPFVWLIRRRLVQEREKACDEFVLGTGAVPQVYAEAILRTCKVYLASSSFPFSGVTGSNLTRRIEGIVMRTSVTPLSRRQKLMITAIVISCVCGPLFVGSIRARGQLRIVSANTSEAVALPRFEVVSIKPNRSGQRGAMGCHATDRGPQNLPLGRCVFTNITAMSLFGAAFNQEAYRMTNFADWFTVETFDIEAKAETPVSQAELALMFQAMFFDRFKLAFHRETKEVAG